MQRLVFDRDYRAAAVVSEQQSRFFATLANRSDPRPVIERPDRLRIRPPRAETVAVRRLAAPGDERFLELHDALDRLAATEPMAARVVETSWLITSAMLIPLERMRVGISSESASQTHTPGPDA